MVAYSGASCVNSKDYEITLNAMPIVEFNAISPVCVNQQSFLLTQGTETTGIAGQGIYSGSGVSPSGFFDPALAGSGTHIITYTFRSTAGDCGNFKTQQVTVHPTPIVSNTSIEILEGGAVVLPAITSETGLSYQWTASNTLSQTNILRPLANPTESITYTLTATDKVTGCSSVGKIEVLVHKIPEIPNTFTPNGDGINDFWIIGYLGTYTDCTVNVFNRNGSLVFKSVGYASPWDGYYNGVELNSGTYFYIIDPKIGRKPMAGSVTIIR
jgi:gliding motility-associated-like protein